MKRPHVRTEPADRRDRVGTQLVLTLIDGREVSVQDRARRHGRFVSVEPARGTHRVFKTREGRQYRVRLASAEQKSVDASWLAKQFAKVEGGTSAA